MPEVELHVRWPDGHLQQAVSPSRAIERFLVQGASYPRAELERRVRDGLAAASDRVRERYGVACSAAVEQSAALAEGAHEHGGDADAPARVERLARRPRRDVSGHDGRRADGAGADRLPQRTEVVIVGGGQAGLSLSWYLRRAGVEHVVLERDRTGGAWSRGRWDSFCLVTPNWQCRLPGHPYDGDDPDGFMVREQIIEYIESFAGSFQAPVREGVAVHRVARDEHGELVVATDRGAIAARQVALCVSGYHHPRVSPLAERLPGQITQLHSSQYRNPSSLPDGAVLVVGTGQSGAQIAEDLHIGGREVHLSVGSAPRCARRYRGRDCIAWLQEIGHYDMGIDEHPKGTGARREPNHYMTGRGGGHDIDLRAFAREGMTLHGRLSDVVDGTLRFAGDLRDNLDGADAAAERIKDTIDQWIAEQGLTAPAEARYSAVWEPAGDGSAPLDLAAAGVRSVVWATGFAADWSWVAVDGYADGSDGDQSPVHTRGICEAEGLYVLGLPWLWTWGSGRFAGIARDAEHVAERITQRAQLAARAA